MGVTSPTQRAFERLAIVTGSRDGGRHHFKRAYYSECRRDAASAFKHWTSCYEQIRALLRVLVTPGAGEAEPSKVPLYEVKRVADFVSRKAPHPPLPSPSGTPRTTSG